MMKSAITHLRAADPKMARLIERHGAPRLRRERDAWKSLSSAIIGQQVSVHAARAIRGRFAAIVANQDYPRPADILTASDESLRTVGLSGNKVLSLRDLARHFEDGAIPIRRFPRMTDEEIIATLVPVRGIGRWTAEMFLLFSLGRMDVLAVDDLGLRNAICRLYDVPAPLRPDTMRVLAQPWQPYRSIASWYLWRSLDDVPNK